MDGGPTTGGQDMIKTIISAGLLVGSFYLGWFINGSTHGTELLIQFEKGYLNGVRETTNLFKERLKI